MSLELISRFTCIAHLPVCVFVPGYVCVCVWFLCNIPNLSNFGPRLEALLFSWRSRRATRPIVHFGNRLKLWTSHAAATHLNNLFLPVFQVDLYVNVAVDLRCECGSWLDVVVGAKTTYHANNTSQFKRRPQGKKNNLSVIARFAYMSWQQRLFNV